MEIGNAYCECTRECVPIDIGVEKSSKREKSRKKWQNIFLALYFVWCRWQIGGIKIFSFSYVRMRAPSNSDVDFLLSQVSQRGKIEFRNWGKSRQEMEVFQSIIDLVWVGEMGCLLKCICVYDVIVWYIVYYDGCCDTCDSKKAKTPVMRAYACAWERVIVGIFTYRKTQLLMNGSSIVFSAPECCLKTTRHFS